MTSAPASPFERRRSQQRQEARRTILDATEALLVEAGYERFSMRRLAERCGYTAPSIYHHFGDKQSLLDTVVEERFQLVLDRIGRVRRRPDPADTVRAVLLELARFGIENPTHYRLLSMARAADSTPPGSAEKARAALEQHLTELAEEGRLAMQDLEHAANFLWIVLHGFVSLRISRPESEWVEGQLEFCIEGAMRGLLGGPPGAAS